MKKTVPEIMIMSRDKVEEFSITPFHQRIALISITDANYSFADLRNKPHELLQVAFDDVDNDVFEDELGREPTEEERVRIERRYNMLSDVQAKEIADFYKRVKDTVDVIICQCEHGQSRSAAVAAAIQEFSSHTGIEIFADDRYYPNKVVYRKVFRALHN